MNDSLSSEVLERCFISGLVKMGAKAKIYISKVSEEDFENHLCKVTIRAIKRLDEQSRKLDKVSILTILKPEKITRTQVWALVDQVKDFDLVQTHFEEVKELSDRRKLERGLGLAGEMNFNTMKPQGESIDFLKNLLNTLNVDVIGGGDTNNEILEELERRCQGVKDGTIKLVGLSGIPKVDKSVNLEGNEFVVIAGDSHEGKSWMITQWAYHYWASYKWPSKIYSLEMENVQVMRRLISNLSGIDAGDFRDGTADTKSEVYLTARRAVLNADISINDKGGLTLSELERDIYNSKYNNGTKVFFLDHGLLLNLQGRNEDDKVAALTGRLKAICKNLDVVIIMLWQMTKELQKSPYGEPYKQHIRGSGMIFADADIVVCPWRPEVHGAKTIVVKSINVNVYGKAIWKILKNRVGKSQSDFFLLDWKPELGGFFDTRFASAQPTGAMKKKWNKDDDDMPF
jgi:replicative DNA helicase